MQITAFFTTVVVFVASAAAQSATATGATPTSTSSPSGGGDLNSIVAQVPQCALTCLDSTAKSIGCTASDLTCLCSKSEQLISSISPCILLSSGCSSQEQSQIQTVAGNLCSDVSSADSAELASASNAINSALATGTTGTASAPSSTSTVADTNAGARADLPLAGMGAMGAVAAFAVLAL